MNGAFGGGGGGTCARDGRLGPVTAVRDGRLGLVLPVGRKGAFGVVGRNGVFGAVSVGRGSSAFREGIGGNPFEGGWGVEEAAATPVRELFGFGVSGGRTAGIRIVESMRVAAVSVSSSETE